MTEWCASIKRYWNNTEFQDIETCGNRINPRFFRIATLITGVAIAILLIAAKSRAFGPVGSIGFKVFLGAFISLGLIQMSLMSITILASFERREEIENRAFVYRAAQLIAQNH